VGVEDLRKVFVLPRAQAANCLKISTNCLKRLCRKQGIDRWPYRKIVSLENLAESCRKDARKDREQQEAILCAIAEERARVIADPNHTVDDNLLHMRMMSYKHRYASRKRQEGPARRGSGGGALAARRAGVQPRPRSRAGSKREESGSDTDPDAGISDDEAPAVAPAGKLRSMPVAAPAAQAAAGEPPSPGRAPAVTAVVRKVPVYRRSVSTDKVPVPLVGPITAASRTPSPVVELGAQPAAGTLQPTLRALLSPKAVGDGRSRSRVPPAGNQAIPAAHMLGFASAPGLLAVKAEAVEDEEAGYMGIMEAIKQEQLVHADPRHAPRVPSQQAAHGANMYRAALLPLSDDMIQSGAALALVSSTSGAPPPATRSPTSSLSGNAQPGAGGGSTLTRLSSQAVTGAEQPRSSPNTSLTGPAAMPASQPGFASAPPALAAAMHKDLQSDLLARTQQHLQRMHSTASASMPLPQLQLQMGGSSLNVRPSSGSQLQLPDMGSGTLPVPHAQQQLMARLPPGTSHIEAGQQRTSPRQAAQWGIPDDLAVFGFLDEFSHGFLDGPGFSGSLPAPPPAPGTHMGMANPHMHLSASPSSAHQVQQPFMLQAAASEPGLAIHSGGGGTGSAQSSLHHALHGSGHGLQAYLSGPPAHTSTDNMRDFPGARNATNYSTGSESLSAPPPRLSYGPQQAQHIQAQPVRSAHPCAYMSGQKRLSHPNMELPLGAAGMQLGARSVHGGPASSHMQGLQGLTSAHVSMAGNVMQVHPAIGATSDPGFLYGGAGPSSGQTLNSALLGHMVNQQQPGAQAQGGGGMHGDTATNLVRFMSAQKGQQQMAHMQHMQHMQAGMGRAQPSGNASAAAMAMDLARNSEQLLRMSAPQLLDPARASQAEVQGWPQCWQQQQQQRTPAAPAAQQQQQQGGTPRYALMSSGNGYTPAGATSMMGSFPSLLDSNPGLMDSELDLMLASIQEMVPGVHVDPMLSFDMPDQM